MKQRYQLIKDEIMYLISLSPEAMHSIGGMHDRLKDKVTRAEIDRAVACLLSRQHIKKLGAYVFGLGTGDGIEPYPLDDYQADALAALDKPASSNKHQIAAAEQKRQQQTGSKKTLQAWSGGNEPTQPEAAEFGSKDLQQAGTPSKEQAQQPTKESDVNYALAELEHRLIDPPCPQVRDLHIKINVLERLALIVDPTIGGVLEQIKHDLKGVAA